MVLAGLLTAKQLTEVEPGVFLSVVSARAYRRCKADFRKHGKDLDPVNRYSGYRSKDVQNGMHDASLTPRGSSARAHYGLSAVSTVPVSAHPGGKHQRGDAIDFTLNGSSAYPNSTDRAIFKKHGWIFEFGDDDPNHIRHILNRSILPVTRAWCIKNRIWVHPPKK